MEDQNVMSLLKLRAGYGKTGNDSIEDFLWQDIYSLSAQYQGIVAAVLERQQNPNLGWEEAYMTSIGLDMEFINRINVTLDLYNIDNKNLLLAVPLAPSTGFFEFMDNVGTVNNKGIELAVDADISRTGEAHRPLSSPPCLSPRPPPVKSEIITKERRSKGERGSQFPVKMGGR